MTSSQGRYLVVATKPWNRRIYTETICYYPWGTVVGLEYVEAFELVRSTR